METPFKFKLRKSFGVRENDYGGRELWLLCSKVTIMVLESDFINNDSHLHEDGRSK
jgi:hypothetical protein